MERSAAVVLLCLGVFLLELARRARHGLVTPGSGLGWRTTATTRSDAAWYAGQRAAVPFDIAGGVVLVIGGVLVVPFGFAAVSPLGGILGVLGIAGGFVVNRAANRAEDEVDHFG
jgi:hypothetical protein